LLFVVVPVVCVSLFGFGGAQATAGPSRTVRKSGRAESMGGSVDVNTNSGLKTTGAFAARIWAYILPHSHSASQCVMKVEEALDREARRIDISLLQ